MFLNNFFRGIANYADRHHGNGDDFRKMIVEDPRLDPDYMRDEMDIAAMEKKEIAESENKTYDPYGRDEMIENQIDDAIEAKHQKNESDWDKYKGELDWDRREEL